MGQKIIHSIRACIPKPLFTALQPFYHLFLSSIATLLYRFPSRNVRVLGVTGTKGKSTVTEIATQILEEAGFTVALSNTLRFKIGDTSKRNIHKMTMPGRFFIQKFLRSAVDAGCNWVVLELTSEGVKQFRHKFISLDALIFTNISPEHIESHGSFEKYRNAKRALGTLLASSNKKEKVIVANADDPEGDWYLKLPVSTSAPFSLKNAKPYKEHDRGYTFTFGTILIDLHLPGIFNLYNALSAATFARSIGIDDRTIKRGVESISTIKGRVEYVQEKPFSVVVDYAHTPDSLSQFYSIFKNNYNICVLGNTGGGRDTWKRPEMAKIAEKNCNYIILTNEDPYDENPKKIVQEMAQEIINKENLEIILNRRSAIDKALKIGYNISQHSDQNVNVLITGKGTDPYIMGASGNKIPWDDARVVRELLEHAE